MSFINSVWCNGSNHGMIRFVHAVDNPTWKPMKPAPPISLHQTPHYRIHWKTETPMKTNQLHRRFRENLAIMTTTTTTKKTNQRPPSNLLLLHRRQRTQTIPTKERPRTFHWVHEILSQVFFQAGRSPSPVLFSNFMTIFHFACTERTAQYGVVDPVAKTMTASVSSCHKGSAIRSNFNV